MKRQELVQALFTAMSHDICVTSEWEDDEDALMEELQTADEDILKEYAETFLKGSAA